MAARKKSAGNKPASKAKSARQPSDVLALLRADHQKVDQLFKQFEKTRSDARRKSLADEICSELTVHAQVEEEIFYPAVREALRKDQDLLDEAKVEHASLKDLIAQIDGASPGEALFDAKVTVLGEYVKHHVKDEQNELFPKVRKTKLDLKALRDEVEARKLELAGGAAEARGGSGMAGSGRRERSAAKSVKARESEGLLASMARGMGFSEK